MNDSEINAKLDDIKRLTPLILASILDIAHRTEELARLHATLKGNNQPEALVSSVVGMVAVAMSGETYLLAKRLEIKTAMEALAQQTSSFWTNVDAISGNSHLGKVAPRESGTPNPNIDFNSLLKSSMPPADSPFPALTGGGGRPRIVTRPPDKTPEKPETKPTGGTNNVA